MTKSMLRVWLVMVVASQARADDPKPAADPAIFYGYWMWAGADGSPAPQHLNPKAACKDWEAARKKSGQKFELIGVKQSDATSQPSYMCTYLDKNDPKKPTKDMTGPVISAYYRCPNGARAITLNNSGLIADYRCRCDDPAGTCKSESPPAPENSARCTQDPAPQKRSKAEVDSLSKANAAKAKKADPQLAKDYAALADEHANDTCAFKKADFYPDAPSDVNIGYLCGKYEADFAAANNLAGLAKTPPGWVWHHHEEMGRMQLISKAAHDACKHTGGVGIWQETLGLKDYPNDFPKRIRLPVKP